ncbi:DUF3857 domain-containing protein [Xanthomarina sp. F2636L]|uniref:DUF3857 domain-containing protein n=1 Tax=Xanthomarina sp. F2636L TaxID=2996018 RepID=UPI00225DF1CA|nr:DUF3857 domain-containing protein [Xanthomarina sp. F2636L]MCX7551782.1 DUF3857 domain-containing protein [Xanthomarina sp. F2636L]
MQKIILLVLSSLIYTQIAAQDDYLLHVNSIPLELRVKSNAVVRFNDVQINIIAYNKVVYTNKRIITVLNKEGDYKVDAYHHYDENINIQNLEARVFNSNGKEIKKFKKNDFKDVSAVSGGTLYSDSRVKYLDYTPINYPYTILFETKVIYNSTAFIPSWLPIEGFYVSSENNEYKITNTSEIPIKIKTSNFEAYNIKKISDFHYRSENLQAIEPEAYSPDFKTYAPILKAALTQFDMEGIKGVNTNWEDFGLWINNSLISGTQELPQAVKNNIKYLTENANSNMEKAKIVYEYMQDKTRYISVQVGIGGWKPMEAQDVDRLAYGDCKALTNYTQALLKEVGVPSYYTIIYGADNLIDIDQDFSATQGNHAILCLPNNGDYVWLECTSKTNPFGYNANFTDDREALIITPEGGKIVRTKVYHAKENLQEIQADIILDDTGTVIGEIKIQSKGAQYGKHEGIQTTTVKEQELYYKNDFWSDLNNLEILKMNFNNNKDSIVFTEDIKVKIPRYASKAGNRLLFQPNLFNKITKTPPRYKNRKLPFVIERGYTDVDTYEIQFSNSLHVEAIKEPVTIKNKFGSYKLSITTANNIITYKRELILNKGTYSKEDYQEFRDFCLSIKKHDSSKIVFNSKT